MPWDESGEEGLGSGGVWGDEGERWSRDESLRLQILSLCGLTF